MSNTVNQNLVEFSLYDISDNEFIEEGKVMVTSGISIDNDGSLELEGMVYLI